MLHSVFKVTDVFPYKTDVCLLKMNYYFRMKVIVISCLVVLLPVCLKAALVDVNQDGVYDRNEFNWAFPNADLYEEFGRIDTNNDGLITGEEADIAAIDRHFNESKSDLSEDFDKVDATNEGLIFDEDSEESKQLRSFTSFINCRRFCRFCRQVAPFVWIGRVCR